MSVAFRCRGKSAFVDRRQGSRTGRQGGEAGISLNKISQGSRILKGLSVEAVGREEGGDKCGSRGTNQKRARQRAREGSNETHQARERDKKRVEDLVGE